MGGLIGALHTMILTMIHQDQMKMNRKMMSGMGSSSAKQTMKEKIIWIDSGKKDADDMQEAVGLLPEVFGEGRYGTSGVKGGLLSTLGGFVIRIRIRCILHVLGMYLDVSRSYTSRYIKIHQDTSRHIEIHQDTCIHQDASRYIRIWHFDLS
jgi:hypothetical protein